MYTIKRAAELIGITPDTLRVWERRYGIVSPLRSEGNYRLYDDEALRVLSAMAALVNAGWSPSQAASRVRAREATGEMAERPASLGDAEALARVAVDFDIRAMGQVLDTGFAHGSFEEVVDGWLMPALQRLGNAWHEGRVTVAEEHFVSAGVERRLATIFDRTERPDGGPRVLMGLGPGSRHELGLLAFAIAALRAGIDVVYLGADVPTDSWLSSIADEAPRAVVLSVPILDDLAAVRDIVTILGTQQPDLPVFVGGSQQEQVGGRAVPLGHEIVPGVRRLVEELRVAPTSGPT